MLVSESLGERVVVDLHLRDALVLVGGDGDERRLLEDEGHGRRWVRIQLSTCLANDHFRPVLVHGLEEYLKFIPISQLVLFVCSIYFLIMCVELLSQLFRFVPRLVRCSR